MSTTIKNFRNILFILTITLYFSSCADKYCQDQASFTSSFTEFSENIKLENESFTKEIWAAKDKDFQYYTNNCYPKYKSQLSIKDKVTVLKNMIAYSYYRSEDGNINLEMDNVNVDFEEELAELTEESKKELERFLVEEFGSKIEKAVDDVLKTINNIGDEIKNWLNKKKD